MPGAFNFQASPFDRLTADEQGLVRASVDIGYWRAGEVLLELGARPESLFVVIKGRVRETDGRGEPAAAYGPDDAFDGRALVAEKASSRFVAEEEVLAYAVPRATVLELIARNAAFGALLFAALSSKMAAATDRASQHELQSLTLARVGQAFVRPAHTVDASTDILSVVRLFQAQRTNNVLVRDASTQPPRLGIFTATALQRAVLDGTPLDRLPVGRMANYSLVKAGPDDALGDALAVMIRHRVHRVVVTRPDPGAGTAGPGGEPAEQVLGILEAMDLFAYLSNHSYFITIRILEAQDLGALAEAAAQITRLAALLHKGGTRVAQIAALVQELDAQLFERAWRLVAPPEVVANSCLFVMGSEGRGEQLLKTDQDNGLVWRDGWAPPAELPAICEAFGAALRSFGYPDCPGRIMVGNPAWRGAASDMGRTVRGWLLEPSAERLMNLAIFLDAQPVAGDPTLLAQVREPLLQLATDNAAMLARFASAIDAFDSGSGWWTRLVARDNGEGRVDIKKAGTFPLVHGVRALALEHRIAATGTVPRLQALVARGVLDEAFAGELADSLHFFMGLKLAAGLAEMEAGQPVSGTVRPERLSSLERDLLKDTLAVVRRLRSTLRLRYHLDTL